MPTSQHEFFTLITGKYNERKIFLKNLLKIIINGKGKWEGREKGKEGTYYY
jgi:hypothetical protein